MKHLLIAGSLLLAATGLTGCFGSENAEEGNSGSPLAMFSGGPSIPEGTALDVSLRSEISSETASVGDAWSGTTQGDIVVDGEVVVPAGSAVSGRVSGAIEAKRGDRAMLDLEVTSVQLDGKSKDVTAVTEPVIAGSPRARNLGAIAAGAAAGAIIGRAVGDDGADAAKGAVIGGAAAGVGVAASKGYQVVLKPGTVLTFTVK